MARIPRLLAVADRVRFGVKVTVGCRPSPPRRSKRRASLHYNCTPVGVCSIGVGLKEPMRRRPSSRLLIIDRNNRVLLFRFTFKRGPLAGQNYWATPGGALEAGESFTDAATRQ